MPKSVMVMLGGFCPLKHKTAPLDTNTNILYLSWGRAVALAAAIAGTHDQTGSVADRHGRVVAGTPKGNPDGIGSLGRAWHNRCDVLAAAVDGV